MKARALLDEVFKTRLTFGPDAHEQMRDVLRQMGAKPAQDNPRFVNKATQVNGQRYRLKIGNDPYLHLPGAYSVIFSLEGALNPYGMTGTGNQFQVLGGMANEVRQWAIRTLPAYITFTAEGATRIRLYKRIIDIFLKELNGAYVLDQRREITRGTELFILRAKRAETTVPEPEEFDPDDDLVY